MDERKNKGFGIVSEIIAILEEIPLGRYKHEIGLKLRQAMFLNGILYNSEAWHSVSEEEIRTLETVDEHLLRAIVKGHAKTPLEFLYMEAGAIPIRFLITCRRLIYHQVIIKREDSELTKRIYCAQKNDPTPGDFTELLAKDFEMIDEIQNDETIKRTNSNSYKQFIKSKIRMRALKYLKSFQQTHSKVKEIVYEKLEVQPYLTSPLFSNDEVNLLHRLRSRMTECKANFKQKYVHNLKCRMCNLEAEDQQHLLHCVELSKLFQTQSVTKGKVKYADIFSPNIEKQKVATTLFNKLFKLREHIIEEKDSQMAPSFTSVQLKMSDNLQHNVLFTQLPGNK